MSNTLAKRRRTGGEDGVEKPDVKNLFNTRGSKRRSRLGVGIAVWDFKNTWSDRNSFSARVERLPSLESDSRG